MLKRIINYLKKSAFTLAETLIVMGIIGVVAALTLPNLNSSTGNKEKVAKVKKIYSNLNDAFRRAEAIYGPSDTWLNGVSGSNFDISKRYAERLLEFIKVSKVCENKAGCWHNTPLGGPEGAYALQSKFDTNVNDYRFILADGTSIDLNFNQIFFVDIDGPNKGKNSMGEDVFMFRITDGDISPCRSFEQPKQCFKYHDCGKWVIENGNMDYLKADSNGNCNNSDVTLNETVTSCK